MDQILLTSDARISSLESASSTSTLGESDGRLSLRNMVELFAWKKDEAPSRI